MNRLLLILTLLACALEAQAQGTMQFQAVLKGSSEVPPNSDPTVANGIFSLTGDTLSFNVTVPALSFNTTGGTINGPAPPGASAAIIFDLGFFVFHPGNDFGSAPYYAFGFPTFTLTAQQFNQLEGGLWYVNITSETMPDGQLRGQILPVPEPSAFALLLSGAGLALWLRRRRG